MMTSTERAKRQAPGVFNGLLYREWLQHGNAILNMVGIWIVCLWVLPVFYNPGWILAFGVLYSAYIAPRLAGSDTIEGSQEFTFTLPPTRKQRYFLRMLLGGSFLLFFVIVGLAAIAFSLPQLVWSQIVESTLTRPFQIASDLVYIFSFIVPICVFLVTFTYASIVNSRNLTSEAAVSSIMICGLLLLIGSVFEHFMIKNQTGVISLPLLAVSSVTISFFGYFAYLGKDGTYKPAPIEKRGSWAIVIIVIIALVVLAILASLLTVSTPHSSRVN